MFLYYLGKPEPHKLYFHAVMLHLPCLENDGALACYIFDTHLIILVIFRRQYGHIIKFSVQRLFLV